MKFLIVFVALFAIALAAPTADGDAQVLRSDYENHGDGHYSYALETSNGIKETAVGEDKPLGPEDSGNSVRGSYSFVAPDGITYLVNYIADENGFQPQGDHLPVAPEA